MDKMYVHSNWGYQSVSLAVQVTSYLVTLLNNQCDAVTFHLFQKSGHELIRRLVVLIPGSSSLNAKVSLAKILNEACCFISTVKNLYTASSLFIYCLSFSCGI